MWRHPDEHFVEQRDGIWQVLRISGCFASVVASTLTQEAARAALRLLSL